MTFSRLLSIGCFLLISLAACLGPGKNAVPETGVATAEPDTVLSGVALRYQTYCSSCHGEQMIAFADREWKHGKSHAELTLSITEGYADAGMPSWGAVFSEAEIAELADYIETGIEHVAKYGFEKASLESDTVVTSEITVVLDTIVAGMHKPWGMAFLPSGDVLVTEKSGILYRIDSAGNKNEIAGVPPVRNDVQGGLLDVILHPDFAENHWLYLSYADYTLDGKDTLSGTAVDRFTLEGDQLTASYSIFRGKPYSKAKWHYGSRFAFDEAGFLFFTASDRANRDQNPQTLANPMGKIHRVYDDGRIPADNPFVDSAEAIASIYTFGHRNLQGLSWNDRTGTLWAHEHGPRGGDELNVIYAGNNYGWPSISYGINYDGTTFTDQVAAEGMEQPVHYWTPSIAPCGMAFVHSDRYPGWEENLMVGSLRFGYLNRCIIEGNKVIGEEQILKNIGRLRNVKMGPDGYLYIAVEQPGYIFRLKPLEEKS